MSSLVDPNIIHGVLIGRKCHILSNLIDINEELFDLTFPHLSSRTAFENFLSGRRDVHVKLDTDLAPYIDHTLLKPSATRRDILRLCEEACTNRFACVCVHPCRVDDARMGMMSQENRVPIATVVGFPHGCNATDIKIQETILALQNGATEVDVVMNVGLLKDGHLQAVYAEMKSIVDCVNSINKHCLVKVILETCWLTLEEILDSTMLAALAKANFVKTSTGFGSEGATLEHVTWMSYIVNGLRDSYTNIKASGGIRTREQALRFIQIPSVHRIGTSNGIALIKANESAR